VLGAVDQAFAHDEVRRGLADAGEEIRHISYRAAERGRVELWPLEAPEEANETDAWRPLDEQGSIPPVERLAVRIADQIRQWIDTREVLASSGLAIEPGDVLILLRRRMPMAAVLIRALKSRGIPVAGADRIRITDQIAVMDLMALGDFVLLPDDDLALASVLKSPLIGLDDNDLLVLVQRQKGTLWSALLGSEDDPRFGLAVSRLKRWRSRADYAPPFEFFASVLGEDDLRRAMLTRLGPEAGDAIDEFTNYALEFDLKHPPSLQGFLSALRDGELQVKRDMDQGRGEVRIMTVHGAKGLEAPIVFLPDTCSTASGGQGPQLLPLGGRADEETTTAQTGLDEAAPFIWAVKDTGHVPAIQDARDAVAHQDDDEYRRLLYVAMTRARDRLYISGYHGARAPSARSWYVRVSEALKPGMAEHSADDGRTIWRLDGGDPATDKAVTEHRPEGEGAWPVDRLPDWFDMPGADERVETIPIMPSRIVAAEEDIVPGVGVADLAAEAARSPLIARDQRRFQRGVMTHALLQYLPDLPPQARRAAAEQYVRARGGDLPERLRRSVVDETLAITESEAHAVLFGPGSHAEVAIAAEVENPKADGRPLAVAGSIDRLVVSDAVVHFVDYKTNRPAPRAQEDVIQPYLVQLAAYRLVLRRLYPDHEMRASLLWTDGARIMTIANDRLDRIEPLLSGATSRLEQASPASYVTVNGPER
ncbi:MAG: 3'-5' exonuclease, partial [Pseudomonadota bacterium]